ncbi:MAG: IS66 family insertion sequence element accessory protein TnpB [Solirubrobacteraceae bacterium]
MLSLPPSVRVFVCTAPTDMRKSFDGLCALVQTVLKQDPFSGHLFTFLNRRKDKVKILYWDRSGFFLMYKRLEEGTFRMPERGEIGTRELMMVLEGLDVTEVRERRWYQRRT